eukprot:scaffold94276_cov57-Phaeocystis_antarctica.AAC.9
MCTVFSPLDASLWSTAPLTRRESSCERSVFRRGSAPRRSGFSRGSIVSALAATVKSGFSRGSRSVSYDATAGAALRGTEAGVWRRASRCQVSFWAASAAKVVARTPRSASGRSTCFRFAGRSTSSCRDVAAMRMKPCAMSALAPLRSEGSFCRQSETHSAKQAVHSLGLVSVGGGADEILNSARIIGPTSQCGGCISASSSAVMPSDQISAAVP